MCIVAIIVRKSAPFMRPGACSTAMPCKPMSYIGMTCLQGTWVLEQSRKEAEMASRANGISSSPVRD